MRVSPGRISMAFLQQCSEYFNNIISGTKGTLSPCWYLLYRGSYLVPTEQLSSGAGQTQLDLDTSACTDNVEAEDFG